MARGEQEAQFPSTAWTLIAGLQGSGPARAESLEALARSYWRAIYSYLRRALRQSHQDAEDDTQAFLAWLLEATVLESYDPGRGPFRPYLKTLVRNFTSNRRRKERARKRGGGALPVALAALGGDPVADPRGETPEEAFDRAWVEELIERATQRVRAQLEQEGNLRAFQIFAAYDRAPAGVLPTYESVSAELEVSENSVRHALYKVRERVRAELRAELRETVRDQAQLEAEWAALILGQGQEG